MKRRIEHALTAVALLLVVWFFHWTVAANNGFENWGDMDYFRLLVRGWLKGQLHLDKDPSPELLALADPYDPAQNEGLKLGDATLFRGRYYVYFGAAPALTIMLPYALITGKEMAMGTATFLLSAVALVAASGLWLAIRRRYFPQSAAWTAPVGIVALGFGTHLLALAQRPMIWELPIAGGAAFTMLALIGCYQAIHGRRPLLAMAMAGLALGLAVGSRPTCLFAAPLLAAPIWFAWRERSSDRVWWRMAIAALLPLSACGIAILAHNYARFENPLEFGQNYQLSGAYESRLTHFSLRFFPHNFAVYFFQLFEWAGEFPFAIAQAIEITHIPGYFGTEEVSGLAVTFPFFWFILALPLAAWRRSSGEVQSLVSVFAAIAGYAIPVMVLILCYFSTCARYQADFAVGLGVLALCGMLGLERWAQQARRGWFMGPLQIGACGVTLGMGALLSFDYHAGATQKSAPSAWQRLDRLSHGVLVNVGHWLGRVPGPRVLKVRFKPQPLGTIETFWRADDARAGDRILLEHVGEHLIRFGHARGESPATWGRLLRWETDHTHTVSVQVPTLYELAQSGWWAEVDARNAFRKSTAVAVWFSGGRALGVMVEPLAGDVGRGGAVGGDFSGEVRKMMSRPFRDDEIATGELVAPHARRGGTLQMRVVLPTRLQKLGEPLFAAGAHYRSSIVHVRSEGEGVRFVYENFGQVAVESELVKRKAGGHAIELELPTFRPEAYGVERMGDVVIRVDGREVLRMIEVAYPFPWGDEAIGKNPFGTTCAASFRGWILDAKWSAARN